MLLSVSVIDESVKLMGSAFWQLIVALAVTLPQAPYFYTGETFCQLTQWVAVTGRVHYIIGGFGIALMRALFVRYPNRLCFGQNATAGVISATTLGSTAFSLTSMSLHQRELRILWTSAKEIQRISERLYFTTPQTSQSCIKAE